jgi:excisionase family DNA binding protein
MSDLYSTRRAAAFLGVSEASVRRWSDQGLLPVQRVGLRRTRRFAEEDLHKFSADAHPMTGSSQGTSEVDGATVGRVQVKVHGHLPIFYESDEGRLRIAVPFLADGLRAGQRCLLSALDAPLDRYLEALREQDGVDVDRAVHGGQLVVLPDVTTTARQFLDLWEQLLWQATSGEPRLVRIVGEMVSVRRLFPSEAEMMDFEAAFSALIGRFPAVVLCQYDAREFDGHGIITAAKAHPDLFELRFSDFLT